MWVMKSSSTLLKVTLKQVRGLGEPGVTNIPDFSMDYRTQHIFQVSNNNLNATKV